MASIIIITWSQISTVLFVLLACLLSLLCVINGSLSGQAICGLSPGTWDKWTSNTDCPWDECYVLSLGQLLWIIPGIIVLDCPWDNGHELSLKIELRWFLKIIECSMIFENHRTFDDILNAALMSLLWTLLQNAALLLNPLFKPLPYSPNLP